MDKTLSSVTTGDPPKEYFEALGKFVHRYSQVEKAAISVLQMRMGISHKVAKAVLGGSSLANTLNTIKRLIEIQKDDDSTAKPLVDAISHLHLIDDMRDRLTHRGISIRDNKLVCDNWVTAKTQDQIEYFVITPEILEAASSDLESITGRLTHYGLPFVLSRLPNDLRKELLGSLQVPWRYKPVRKETPHPRIQSSGANAQPRGRPPRA